MSAAPNQFAGYIEQVARLLLGKPNADQSKPDNLRFGSRGSLSVDLKQGTWFDHEAGNGGGVLDLIAREVGKSGRDAVEWLERHGIHQPANDNPPPSAPKGRSRISATYDYVSEAGELLFQVCRMEPKTFRQRRPDGSGWSWSVAGVRQVPYRLPQLLEQPEALVFIVEGEKDADALASAGMVATCNAGGANKWPNELTQHFKGRRVVILPDNDDPGRSHAQMVAGKLDGVAASVRIVELPGLPEKGDVSDWLAAGHDADELVRLVEAPANDNTPEDDDLQSDEPFRVLGYNRKTFYLFQNEQQQLVEFTKADLTENGFITLAPLIWWAKWFPGKDGGFDRRSASDWLVRECFKAGIYDPSRIRGRGAWMDDGRVVFHFGSHLWVDGRMVPVTAIRSHYVYEADRPLGSAAEAPMPDDEGRKLVEIAQRFRWTKPASAALLAGFVALAPLCGALRWRPHVWITGGAGCGKTTVLNEYVHRLMGGMSIFAQGNSTEAGIRQKLRTDALPVLFDESEQNNEREQSRVQNVLSLIRQASSESAAMTLKGTAQGEAMQFLVRSMFCLSSIQVGMKHQADFERLTVLALRPKREDTNAASSWAKLKDELYWLHRDETLPARLFRRSLELLPITQKNVAVFVDAAARKFGSVREGDQYGTLLAGCWSLMSSEVATPEQAAALIDSYDWDEYRENLEVDESTKALAALLEAPVRLRGGDTATVYEIVLVAADRGAHGVPILKADAEAILQRHGMRIIDGNLLLSNNSQALGDLLKHTPYAADWRGQLLRVAGVTRHQRSVRFSGSVSKCIAIPLGIITASDAGRDGPPF